MPMPKPRQAFQSHLVSVLRFSSQLLYTAHLFLCSSVSFCTLQFQSVPSHYPSISIPHVSRLFRSTSLLYLRITKHLLRLAFLRLAFALHILASPVQFDSALIRALAVLFKSYPLPRYTIHLSAIALPLISSPRLALALPCFPFPMRSYCQQLRFRIYQVLPIRKFPNQHFSTDRIL